MNGFSPVPIDLHNVNLSRELQVRPLAPVIEPAVRIKLRSSDGDVMSFFFYLSTLTSLAFGLSAGHGGGGRGELSQHLGQEEEE